MFKKKNKFWFFIPFLISLLVLIPIIIIISSFFLNTSEYKAFLTKTYLFYYVSNSFILLTGVLFLTSLFGIGCAYFTTFYKFPGSSFFSWALIMGFGIPGYIYAYSLNAFFSNYGLGYEILNFFFYNINYNYNEIIPKVFGMKGGIISLSFSLYVYVYLIVKITFNYQSQNMIDSAKSLGFGPLKIFLKVLIPAARPAIIVGLSLVAMEVLSDFGTVSFFGINTFTMAIYDSWMTYDDLATANQFSFCLIVIIFLFFIIENYSRKNSKFHIPSKGYKSINKTKLVGIKAIGITSFCFIIFFCSFIFPVTQMIYWIIKFPKLFVLNEFIEVLFNTLFLVFLSTSILIFCSLVINYGIRKTNNKFLIFFTTLSLSGYAIPGIIMAVTLLTFFSQLSQILESVFNLINIKSIFIGTTFALFLSYFIRFFSLAINGVRSGYEKLNRSMDDSAAMIGFSKFKTFKNIHLYFLKNNLILVGVLIAIDIIKELPMTLILRPYNFETFATKSYYFASQDLIESSAIPSLSLIFITCFCIILSRRFILKGF